MRSRKDRKQFENSSIHWITSERSTPPPQIGNEKVEKYAAKVISGVGGRPASLQKLEIKKSEKDPWLKEKLFGKLERKKIRCGKGLSICSNSKLGEGAKTRKKRKKVGRLSGGGLKSWGTDI